MSPADPVKVNRGKAVPARSARFPARPVCPSVIMRPGMPPAIAASERLGRSHGDRDRARDRTGAARR